MRPSSLSRKAVLVAAGVGAQNLISQLAVNMVLVRLLGEREIFGSYRQVWLLLNTAFPVFFLGFHLALFYFLPQVAVPNRRAFVTRCLLFLAGSGVVLALGILLGAAPLAGFFNNPGLTPLFRATSLYALFTVPSMLQFYLLIALDRPGLATLYNFLFVLTQSVLIVILVAVGMSLETVFWSAAVTSFLRLAQTLFEIRRRTSGKWLADPGVSWSVLLRYAIPTGMTGTVAIVGEKLDKFIVSSFLDPQTFALYSLGAVEFPAIVLVSTAAATVLRPRISSVHHAGGREEIVRLWRSALRKIALVVAPLAVFLFLFSRELIELLYTGSYGPAAGVFRIYLVLALFRLLATEPILSSVGRARTVFQGGVVFLCVDLVLNILLVRVLGLTGPAWATVVATAVLTAYYASATSAYLGLPISRLVPVGALFRVLLVSLGAGAAALPVKLLHWPHAATLLAAAVVFGGVYLPLGTWGRAIRREDLLLVRGWLPSPKRSASS